MYKAARFVNPIVHINIATGEGYCRIWELWALERCTIIPAGEYDRERQRQEPPEPVKAAALPPRADPDANQNLKPFKRKTRKEEVLQALREKWENHQKKQAAL